MAGHLRQSRFETLRTDVVQALRYHPDGIIHLWAVLPVTLFGPRLAQKVSRPKQPDQALAVHPCNLLHLVKQQTALLPVPCLITYSHPINILASLIYCHLLNWHSPLGNIIFLLNYTLPVT